MNAAPSSIMLMSVTGRDSSVWNCIACTRAEKPNCSSVATYCGSFHSGIMPAGMKPSLIAWRSSVLAIE